MINRTIGIAIEPERGRLPERGFSDNEGRCRRKLRASAPEKGNTVTLKNGPASCAREQLWAK